MLRIGDRYKIPKNQVIIEIIGFHPDGDIKIKCVDFPEPKINTHHWKVGQLGVIYEGWLKHYKCERLPRKSEEFQNLYDKLNADLL